MNGNRSESICGVKEKNKKKIKLLSCSFRRLGMCFRNNVRESAFKFLQFTTYNIISRYFPPHKEMMLFPFSFNFISLLLLVHKTLCAYGANLIRSFVTLLSTYWFSSLYFPLQKRWGSVSLQNWGLFLLRANWPWRSFLSFLPNVFTFFPLIMWFYV